MKFYSIYTDTGKRKKYSLAIPINGYPVDIIVCDNCKRTWKSFSKIREENRAFEVSFSNDYFPDFLSCEAYVLVSEHAKQRITEKKISAPRFTKMPVITKSKLRPDQLRKIRERGISVNKMHDQSPIYYLLGAEVSAKLHPDTGMIWVDSGPNVCTHCGYGVGYKRKSYLAPEFIQQDTWMGNDLFSVQESGKIYCTDRFKELCESEGLTGICFDEILAK